MGTSTITWEVDPGRPARTTVPNGDLDHARDWLREHHDAIRAGLDEHGAVYLSGLGVGSVEDFARVRDTLIDERAGYAEKATPRSHFGDDVYSSTDLPPSQSLRAHNENSYTLQFPGILLFCCLIAPPEGGATPVTDVRKVLRAVPEELADRFRRVGWGLVRNYNEHVGLDWTTSFATEDREEVARYCADNLISHRWTEAGSLRTMQRRSATIRHPRTGEEAWFNHMVFWNEWALDPDVRDVLVEDLGHDGLPFNTMYGDGTPVAKEDVEAVDRAYKDATVRETWQPGDVMIVDNMLAAHGREAFRGDRKILVAMGDPVDLDACAPTVPPAAGMTEVTSGAMTETEPKRRFGLRRRQRAES